MLFNSLDFGIFLPVVAILYWTVFNRHGVRLRNAFLLVCSWFFYGMWDWRFPVDFQLHDGLRSGTADRPDC